MPHLEVKCSREAITALESNQTEKDNPEITLNRSSVKKVLAEQGKL
jgi:hypothetical protein